MTETINVESVAPATAVTINRDQVEAEMTGAAQRCEVRKRDDHRRSEPSRVCRVQVANGNAIFETTGTKVAFPDWRRLVEHCDNAPALDCTIGFAPKQVARLAKIDGGEINAPLRFDFYGTGKPATKRDSRHGSRLPNAVQAFHKLSPNFPPSGWGRWSPGGMAPRIETAAGTLRFSTLGRCCNDRGPAVIRTNNVPRFVVDAYELTLAERAEFDYLNWDAIDAGEDSASFFRFKGTTYDLGEVPND